MQQKLMWVTWPAFLMAGVLELLVFAVIDPQDLNWFGQSFTLSRHLVYTLAFGVFWFVISLSGALTLFLSMSPSEVNKSPL